MWIVSNNNQLISFLVSVLFGVFFCLFYDILRSIRIIGYKSVLGIAVQDVFFCVAAAFITFMLMLRYTCGEVRFYIIFAVVLGFAVCNYTISPFFRGLLTFILKKICLVFGAINKVFKRLKFKTVLLFDKIHIFLKKYAKTLKNHLKQKRKIVYTNTDVKNRKDAKYE